MSLLLLQEKAHVAVAWRSRRLTSNSTSRRSSSSRNSSRSSSSGGSGSFSSSRNSILAIAVEIS